MKRTLQFICECVLPIRYTGKKVAALNFREIAAQRNAQINHIIRFKTKIVSSPQSNQTRTIVVKFYLKKKI